MKKSQKEPTLVEIQANAYDKPAAFKLGEIGYNGFRTVRGIPYSEVEPELQFPKSVRTFNKMSKNSVINASENLFDTIISKADITVIPVEDATEEEKRQARIIAESMNDMDHPWTDFIRDAYTHRRYGFSICEMVFRRRYKSNGSKHNDGVISWKKLPIRVQESVDRFTFWDTTGDLAGVKQNVSVLNDQYGFNGSSVGNPIVVIPYTKLLHFRAGRHRGDPYGKSPLRDAYVAWWYLTKLEELELTGVSKDLVGVPVLYIPPQYLSSDASISEKAIGDYYKNALRNLQNNEQGSMLLPQIYDPETRQPLFKIELMSVQGQKSYDIDKIKQYYKNSIVLSLSTDILTLGQTSVGSFALGSIKNSLAGATALAIANDILEEINRKLIRTTYELNGWDTSRMCKMDIDNISDVDLEALSKYWSRMSAGGLVEVDREILNLVREAGGADAKPIDAAIDYQTLAGNTSKIGEGYKTLGEGTAVDLSPTDAASQNQENVG
jgi:hypothetical protein